ncbi:MAG: hypothetical protein R3Y29_08710 [bacterium]
MATNKNIEHISTLMENRDKLAVAIKKDVEYIVKEETLNSMRKDFDKKLEIMQDYIKKNYNV